MILAQHSGASFPFNDCIAEDGRVAPGHYIVYIDIHIVFYESALCCMCGTMEKERCSDVPVSVASSPESRRRPCHLTLFCSRSALSRRYLSASWRSVISGCVSYIRSISLFFCPTGQSQIRFKKTVFTESILARFISDKLCHMWPIPYETIGFIFRLKSCSMTSTDTIHGFHIGKVSVMAFAKRC
jgi:hypothetical protein